MRSLIALLIFAGSWTPCTGRAGRTLHVIQQQMALAWRSEPQLQRGVLLLQPMHLRSCVFTFAGEHANAHVQTANDTVLHCLAFASAEPQHAAGRRPRPPGAARRVYNKLRAIPVSPCSLKSHRLGRVQRVSGSAAHAGRVLATTIDHHKSRKSRPCRRQGATSVKIRKPDSRRRARRRHFGWRDCFHSFVGRCVRGASHVN